MDNLLTSTAAIFNDASASEWICIFPSGTTKGRDGRGPYVLDNASAVIAASMIDGVDPVVDREHGMDLLPRGTAVPAAGWIKEMQAREDGIYARVEWTPPAQKELQNKEYRYVSPTFMHSRDGKVKRIERLTLTNNPNFTMKAVASAEPNPKEIKMEELLKKLAAKLGLPETATEEDVMAAMQKLADTVTKVKEKVDAPAEAETPEAVAEAVEAKIEKEVGEKVQTEMASRSAKASDPDPSKFVPIAAFKELQDKVSKIETEGASEKATASVDAAIKAGKLTPASRGWGISLASKDPKAFAEFVGTAPTITGSGMEGGAKYAVAAEDGLTDDQRAVCSQLGVTPEDFKKGLKKSV